METDADPSLPANLGLFDGQVHHAEVNRAVAAADKVVLFGAQTRLPHFPEDERLFKLHAGDPLVLLFWRVFKKLPQTLREALLGVPFSITLVRGPDLLFFDTWRRHQAVHIGCRRRTVYLPEVLLELAEEKGYDYWAIAEGLIHASWMLLDFVLLAGVVEAHAEAPAGPERLSAARLASLVRAQNRHRRESDEASRSEVQEFIDGYRAALVGLHASRLREEGPTRVARRLFDPELESRWARDKTLRIAEVFSFPRLFGFDRDIIHEAARAIALRQGQPVAPATFADALHDYRDAWRFEPHPLATTLGRTVMPKPRAVFLQTLLSLGEAGLRGFFAAYASGEADVAPLVHPLWIHLCAQSSDPAGVYARVGRLRAAGREGLAADQDALLAGILIRLDRAGNYPELVAQAMRLGDAARAELEDLVARQRLRPQDEWEVFKAGKQGIVARASEALAAMAGAPAPCAPGPSGVHEDPSIRALLANSPHRLTSDPSGLLLHLRAYQRTLERFGPADPDADFLLAAVLLRLDRSPEYPRLLERVQALGTPALSALHGIFAQIPLQDMRRRGIRDQARLLWSRILARSGRRALLELVREPGARR
ncbi:MAG: hypothetical protein AB1505_33475 [Candidatus Latescibacterota bacterium]